MIYNMKNKPLTMIYTYLDTNFNWIWDIPDHKTRKLNTWPSALQPLHEWTRQL